MACDAVSTVECSMCLHQVVLEDSSTTFEGVNVLGVKNIRDQKGQKYILISLAPAHNTDNHINTSILHFTQLLLTQSISNLPPKHAHTHTHARIQRERERGGEGKREKGRERRRGRRREGKREGERWRERERE